MMSWAARSSHERASAFFSSAVPAVLSHGPTLQLGNLLCRFASFHAGHSGLMDSGIITFIW